ncbi:uncharacterized protein METZ01_LOCUS220818, partial [marine metagenome]
VFIVSAQFVFTGLIFFVDFPSKIVESKFPSCTLELNSRIVFVVAIGSRPNLLLSVLMEFDTVAVAAR